MKINFLGKFRLYNVFILNDGGKENLHHLYTAIRDFAETKSLALVNEYHSMLCFKKERFYGCFDTKEFHLYANLNQKENQSLFLLDSGYR